MSNTVWEMIAAVFVIAIVYMLARPNSPAGQAINDVSGALTNLLLVTTGWNMKGHTNPGNFNNNSLPA